MIGKVLIGLLVAAGLFLIYSILSKGSAWGVTEGGGVTTGERSGSRPLDKTGTYTGSKNIVPVAVNTTAFNPGMFSKTFSFG